MPEFISNAKFYFETDGLTDLLVQKISGMQMKMTVAGGDAPIGVTKDGKTQTQATIGGVECSEITLECVATADSKNCWIGTTNVMPKRFRAVRQKVGQAAS